MLFRLGGNTKINDTPVVTTPAQKARTWALGLLVAVSSGTFGALQYAVVNLVKHHEQSQHGCRSNPATCPAQLQEQFNTFGSQVEHLPVLLMLSRHCAALRLVQHKTHGLTCKVRAQVDGLVWTGCNWYGGMYIDACLH